MSNSEIMLIALALDAVLGWPNWLFSIAGHPVTWIGSLIARLELALNRPQRSANLKVLLGLSVTVATVAITVILSGLVKLIVPDGICGGLILAVLAWPLVAARSLHEHVYEVAKPLMDGSIDSARMSLKNIVGRDPEILDSPGISRATLESLAENTSDGIVAPLFWGTIFGLPGIAAYKTINTLDSMIGHRTPRYLQFGRVSARLDDLANYFPARLTGLLYVLVGSKPKQALKCMVRDARQHRSPNAGWPEAAMAGSLGIRLSGPRQYNGVVSDEPWLNAGYPDPEPHDVMRGLKLLRRVVFATAGLLVLITLYLNK